MALKIQTYYNRFKTIIRGKIKQDLKKFMSNGEMIGKKERNIFPFLFRALHCRTLNTITKKGGVGQGEGDKGQPMSGQAGQGTNYRARRSGRATRRTHIGQKSVFL